MCTLSHLSSLLPSSIYTLPLTSCPQIAFAGTVSPDNMRSQLSFMRTHSTLPISGPNWNPSSNAGCQIQSTENAKNVGRSPRRNDQEHGYRVLISDRILETEQQNIQLCIIYISNTSITLPTKLPSSPILVWKVTFDASEVFAFLGFPLPNWVERQWRHSNDHVLHDPVYHNSKQIEDVLVLFESHVYMNFVGSPTFHSESSKNTRWDER